MSKISVIGAGTMGNGIAQTFALHNFLVLLYDINQENLKNARSTIQKNLNRMLAKESITELEIQNTTNNLIINYVWINYCIVFVLFGLVVRLVAIISKTASTISASVITTLHSKTMYFLIL